jgi:hypothetical protein
MPLTGFNRQRLAQIVPIRLRSRFGGSGAAPGENDPAPRSRLTFSRGKVLPAFWTAASILSLLINIILLAVLLAFARDIFQVKGIVTDHLLGGLYSNFDKMDAAHIVTTITVSDTLKVSDTMIVSDTLTVKDTIPVVFTLPLEQDTVVTLVADTPVSNTTIYLNGAAVPLDLVLPQGTQLNISLNMDIPVSQMLPIELKVPVHMNVPVDMDVPVLLDVPVDIAMSETDLHEAFTGLKGVVGPYYEITADLPGNWEEIRLCGPGTSWVCRWFFNE